MGHLILNGIVVSHGDDYVIKIREKKSGQDLEKHSTEDEKRVDMDNLELIHFGVINQNSPRNGKSNFILCLASVHIVCLRMRQRKLTNTKELAQVFLNNQVYFSGNFINCYKFLIKRKIYRE